MNDLKEILENIKKVNLEFKHSSSDSKMASENDHKCEPEITITAAESNVKSSLIVVSNRLPFVLKKKADGTMMRQAR